VHNGRMRNLTTFCVVAALATGALAPAYAAPAPRRAAISSAAADRGEETSGTSLGPMSNAEVQGFGCLATGGTTTVLTVLGGTQELVLVFAGGSLPPTTSIGLALAVTGTIFASFCAVGALAAPAVVRMWHQYYDGMEVAAVR
jgi:hypothetical protein